MNKKYKLIREQKAGNKINEEKQGVYSSIAEETCIEISFLSIKS